MKSNSAKIKIFFFIPTLKGGGSERVCSILVNNLNKDKFEVHLIVLDARDINYDIDESQLQMHHWYKSNIRKAFVPIYQLIKSEKPDIVFSSLNHLNLMLVMISTLIKGNTKYIGRESSIVSMAIKDYRFRSVFSFMLKKFYGKLDLIICQGVDMKAELINNFNLPEEKTTVINNPVEAKEEFYLDNSSQDRKIRFVTVGLYRKEKGFDRLIKMLDSLSLDFEYWIIGIGEEENFRTNEVKNPAFNKRLKLLGKVENPAQYLEQCDYYLQGSYFEGFPNALLEALVCGLPAIAFDCPGGTKEIIRQGNNGYLVEEGDLEAFRLTILKIVAKDFDRQKIREDVLRRFRREKIIQEYEQAFYQILGLNVPIKTFN